MRRKSRLPNNSQPKATPIDPATAATITGTISLNGTPPKPKPIDMSNDPGCKGSAASEQVVVDDGHLANVLVYVKDGLGDRSFDPPQQSRHHQAGRLSLCPAHGRSHGRAAGEIRG